MEVDWLPLRDAEAYRVWAAVLQPVAAQMRAKSAELAEHILTRVRAEVPALFPDVQVVSEAAASTEESLRQLAQIIEVGADPTHAELPPSTQAIFRSAVWRNILIADHLRFYRLAQGEVWRWLFIRIVAASRNAEDQALAVELATGWVFAFVDRAMTRANQAYEIERESWMRGAAATRAAAIDDIVGDRERDQQAAARRLRYDLGRHHVGFIAWVDRSLDNADALPTLNTALSDLARKVHAEATITHPLGSLAVAAWFSGSRTFAMGCLDVVHAGGSRLELPTGVRIAVGEPGHDLRGFRQTHVEAGHSRRVASLVAPHDSAITRYRDVAVAALCSADGGHAVTFVNGVLGPLANDDEVTSRLASTLAAYLRDNLSRTKAAASLHIHPNTVSYRVRQAEELLGRKVGDDSLDVRVALELLPALARLRQDEPQT
jgi:DNA-binding PucR family transcriptional regulator